MRMFNFFFLIPDDFNFRSEDQDIYVNLGLSMLQTGDFVRQEVNDFYVETARMPLYPAFLSAVWSLSGYNPWIIIFLQLVIDALSCVMIGLIVSQFVSGSFILGGVLSTFNMNMIASSGMILTDSLFLFVFTLCLYAILIYLNKKELKYMILLSIMLSLSVLTRSVSYYLIPIFGVALLWYLISNNVRITKLFVHITTFVLIVAVLLGVLVNRNYQQFGTIEITSQSGVHLSKYLVPLVIHFSEGKTYSEAATEVTSMAKHCKSSSLVNNKIDAFKLSHCESRIAIDRLLDISTVKITYAWLVGSVLNLSSSGVMVTPWLRSLPHQSFYNTPGDTFVHKIVTFITDAGSIKYIVATLISNLISFLMFILKCFGAYLMVKNRRHYIGGWGVFFVLGTIFYFLLITGPVLGVKYMLPIEPLLTILLVIGIRGVINKNIGTRRINKVLM
jgi:hypothetical protein